MKINSPEDERNYRVSMRHGAIPSTPLTLSAPYNQDRQVHLLSVMVGVVGCCVVMNNNIDNCKISSNTSAIQA